MRRRLRLLFRSRLRTVIIVLAVVFILLMSGMFVTAIQLENRDSFCASCHTEPETAYYQRTLAEPVDLASAHSKAGVACIDCHSGGGIDGRLIGLTQGATDLIAYVTGNYVQPAVTTNPVGDQACTKCHIQPSLNSPISTDSRAMQSTSHYHTVELITAWKQATNTVSTCAQCHVPHPGSGDSKQLWMTESTVEATCRKCHSVLAR